MSLIVNIYGGPCSGKSTRISYIAAILKLNGISCEICPEFAKEEIYRGMPENLKDQRYIFGNQQHILSKLAKMYDVIIVDGTLLNCVLYSPNETKQFHDVIYEEYKKYENKNYFIKRNKELDFQQVGRVHNLEESLKKDKEIIDILESLNEDYVIIDDDYNIIFDDISEWLFGKKGMIEIKNL